MPDRSAVGQRLGVNGGRRLAPPQHHPSVPVEPPPAAYAPEFELCGLHPRLVYAARRVALDRQPVVRSHADVAPLLAPFVERFGLVAALLNRRGRLIAVAHIGGQANACKASAGAIYRAVIATGAHALYLAHCHKDGAAHPSTDDLASAARVYELGFALGLELRDSLIFGPDGSYISLRDRGEGADDWRRARERGAPDHPCRRLLLHQSGANRRPQRPSSSRSDGARASLWCCPACERRQNYKHACRYCGAPRPGESR